MGRLCIIFFVFFGFNLFSEMTSIRLPREDGSLIKGYLSLPDGEGSFPVIVFIDGSWENSVLAFHEKLSSRFNPHQIALLSIEKRGLSATDIDRQDFLEHNCFEERLQDHILLLGAIENREISGCNGGCILLGASEGGKIAPKLNLLFPELIKGLVLIGSGGGLSFAEEMKYQFWQRVEEMSFLKRKSFKMRGALMPSEHDESYAKMLASPDSLEIYRSKTWKWWASYLRYDVALDLLKVDAPIYMIHGELDTMVPIESADLIKKAFDEANKTNFTYARYSDVGHSLAGREDVYLPMTEWIKHVAFPQ
ncbi:MAG: alpha/beta hydrolase [Chlamydiae bacterium]|nr:alpha/beta hydrolase [Chlamydiota bacterium]